MKNPSSSQSPRRTTRRGFLKGAAAGAALAATAPSARLYARILGANDRIRIGVVGPGGMGTGHVVAFSNFGASGRAPVEIVAVSDVAVPHMERAKGEIQKRMEGVEVGMHQDYRELLARQDVDGIVNATPEHWHANIAVDAVAAGKDVYNEKPLCMTLDDAFRVQEAVEGSDRVFQVGTQKMALAKYRAARDLIADGAIGKPLWSQTGYCRNTPSGEWNYYGIEKDLKPGVNLDWKTWCGPKGERPWDPKVYHRWRRYRDFSTGIIGDLLVHQMTPMMYALDADFPTKVFCAGEHMVDLDMENHDQVLLTVGFPDGHTMVVAGNTNNEQGFTDMIRGQKGTLYLGGKDCELRPERPFADDVEPQVVECPQVHDQDELRLNWLQSMQTREAPFSPVQFAVKVMVVVDLATRSAWDGRAYAFDPETRKVTAL